MDLLMKEETAQDLGRGSSFLICLREDVHASALVRPASMQKLMK